MTKSEKELLSYCGILDFLKVIKQLNSDWVNSCSRCSVPNGECHQLASEGRCNAWNEIKCKEKALSLLINKEVKE